MKTEKNKGYTVYMPFENLPVVNDNVPDTYPLQHENFFPVEMRKIEIEPEKRPLHKAMGAYGVFTVTNDISMYTRAKIFSEVGKKTPLFARFSVLGSDDANDHTDHNSKEFSIKFFTEAGEWDLPGNNMPVYLAQDIEKCNDFFYLKKRDQRTNLKNPTLSWDFFSRNPESLHQVMMLMSERGLTFGYRHMDGFGVHTFSMLNSNGEKIWVKFHFKTMQGIKTLTREEACAMYAEDSDHAQRDLVDSINKKNFPKWKLFIQIMTDQVAKQLSFNPFDPTKVWSQKLFPLMEVGIMELNKLPENYSEEIEQVNFNLENVVDGINFSPDKMLQSKLRMNSKKEKKYVETPERITTGENRTSTLKKNDPKYLSYSFSPLKVIYVNKKVRKDRTELKSSGGYLSISGYYATDEGWYDYNHANENDHFTQPGIFFRKVMLETERAELIGNIVASMKNINGPESENIIIRQMQHWYKVDPDLGNSIALGLGLRPAF